MRLHSQRATSNLVLLVSVPVAAAIGPEAEKEHGEHERELDDRDDEVEVGERFGVGGDRRDGEGGADGGESPINEERGRADGSIGIEVVGSVDGQWSVSSASNSKSTSSLINFMI